MLSKQGIIDAYLDGTIVYAGVSEEQFYARLNPNSINISLGQYYFLTDENNDALNYGDKLANARRCKLQQGTINLQPGCSVICHSEEFVGARAKYVPCLSARSSAQRTGITICNDAGFGDVGYINRWSLRITNNNAVQAVILKPGDEIGQIYFTPLLDHNNTPETNFTTYSEKGSYQHTDDLQKLMSTWHPYMLLGVITN